MKASFYNIFFKDDDAVVGFNCLSCSMLKMGMEEYKLYDRVCSGENVDKSSPEVLSIIDELKEQRFLVDNDVDELDIVRVEHYRDRFDTDAFNVTIAPTLNCNFNCVYCLEGQKTKGFMTKETENNIIKYIEERASRFRSIRVLWFGGEPTLALEQVFNISKSIMRIAEKYKIDYVAAMVTNGYLLNREIALEFKKHNIESVTLTLDGPPEIHDRRRPLKSGKGTFDVILNNIREIVDIINVHVLCIVDKRNADNVTRLLDIFEENGLSKRIYLTPRPTQPLTSSCMSVSHIAYDIREFAELIKNIYPLLLDRGFNIRNLDPRTKHSKCGSIGNKGIAIAPNGDIHFCNESIYNAGERIGNVSEPIYMNNNAIKWLSWDPFEIEECRNCKILPMCMGGCPYLSVVKDTGVTFENRCFTSKYNLEDILKIIYKKKKGVEA